MAFDLLFDDVWSDYVHSNTRNLVLARVSPFLVLSIVIVYLISLPIAKSIGNRVPRNWSPILIPYFGLFFGCYSVGILIALLMTNWSTLMFACVPAESEFNQLVITYLQFMFTAFQFLHLFDTIFLLLAGHSKLVTRAHIAERVLMIARSYIDLKVFPIGVGCVSAIYNSIGYAVNYSYFIRFFASAELRPNSNWTGRVTTIRVLIYSLLTVHAIYSLTIVNCQSPQLIRLSQVASNFILLIAFACELCSKSDSKSADKQKKRR